MDITILHNPRCSKSRQTLKLIEENNLKPDVVEYLKTPPDRAGLEQILALLAIGPRDLLRKGESIYKELGLGNPDLDDGQILDAMLANPVLIERPIVIANGKAVIGRPPERVLEIL